MNIPKLVIRNITRRKGRLIFTLMGITIGIASFVTFLSLGGSLKSEIMRESNSLGANLVVTPKGSCAYEQVSILTGEQLPTTITAAEVAAVRGIKGLTVAPFLTGKTAIDNRPLAVSGIIPTEMKQFKGWEVAEGNFLTDGDDGVVIGSVVAEQFKLKPGGGLTVRGESLKVKGVLKETGSRDDLTVFMALPLAQRLFKAMDRVSYIAVKVDDLAKTDAYIQKITETVSLGVVSDKQMLKSVLTIVGSVNVTLQLIAAVAVLASAFGIINTMMAATYERKREIGILQAIGATHGKIFTIFMIESGVYGLVGGAIGVFTGLFLSVFAAPLISQNAFTAFVKGSGGGGAIDPKVILGSIGFSVVIALVSGIYPAWRAARLSPVEAISYE